MIDPRLQAWAKVLVNYSLAIKPGDTLYILAPELAAPLVGEVYREALRAGAMVDVQIRLEALDEIFYSEASDEQLGDVSPMAKLAVEQCSTLLSIRAAHNTKAGSSFDPRKVRLAGKASAWFTSTIMERAGKGDLRWSTTLFPTDAHAQDAAMSLVEYEHFVYSACLLDQPDPIAAWKQVGVEQQHIIDYLRKHDTIHITAPGTDLTYRVGGRTWINADGKRNFPDGEVFTAPIEDSANGTVRYTYPAIVSGREVEGITLTFKDGKAIEATAAHGQQFLLTMLDMDAGSRFLGEVAFGLNYGVKRFSGQILFDEKLGGTMHMALGAAYPDTGGTNKSGLHWDMICDLREGEVYADGELCYQAGHFTI